MIDINTPEIELNYWDSLCGWLTALVLWPTLGGIASIFIRNIQDVDARLFVLMFSWMVAVLPAGLIGGAVYGKVHHRKTFAVPFTRRIRIVKTNGTTLQCRFLGKWFDAVRHYGTMADESEICAELINAYRDMRQKKRARNREEIVYDGRV